MLKWFQMVLYHTLMRISISFASFFFLSDFVIFVVVLFLLFNHMWYVALAKKEIPSIFPVSRAHFPLL